MQLVKVEKVEKSKVPPAWKNYKGNVWRFDLELEQKVVLSVVSVAIQVFKVASALRIGSS